MKAARSADWFAGMRYPSIPAVALLILLVSCATTSPRASSPSHSRPSPSSVSEHPSSSHSPSPTSGAVARIAVVVMENRDYSSVIGSSDAPYVNGLAARYGLATNSYAVSHPSLPNYLALLAGSTFGINSDCTDCSVGATNLIDQLESADISWRAYMEDMPSPCFTGAQADGYAKKHDPFVYFDDIVNDPSRCSNLVPFSRLGGDAASGALPDFIWITPNLCNDGHDCSTAAADSWLAVHIPALLKSLGRGGILFLTWDEGEGTAGCCGTAAGGHIVTIVAGPGAKSGVTLTSSVDHYSILKTIEELYGANLLRGAACTCTNDLSPLLRGP
jgi:hypothetical protein